MGAMIAELLVNGLVMGSVYILVGVGFCLIYGIFKVLNFAHCEVYMIGGFVGWMVVTQYHMNYFMSILAALVICGIVGVIIERTVFHPLRNASGFTVAMASVGLAQVFQDSAVKIWGPDTKLFQTLYSEIIIRVGDIAFSIQKFIVFIISAVLISITLFMVRKTLIGKAIRAISQDREAASLMGINNTRIAMIVFGLGSAVAGVAGPLLVPLLSLDPFMGSTMIVKVFIMVVLGGFSLEGVILAGIFIGIVESFGSFFLSPTYVNSITFTLMIAALLIRPTGLISERLEENI